jgi:hypothetical protein
MMPDSSEKTEPVLQGSGEEVLILSRYDYLV